MSILATPGSCPVAFVTVNRMRRPLKGDVCRLRDGEEYEIELFNPTQGKVACRITVDGRPIGDQMLVLRPGQRYYLDRWLSEPRRLKFSTYVADGSAEGRAAAALNGLLRVEFFREVPRSVPDPSPGLWVNTFTTFYHDTGTPIPGWPTSVNSVGMKSVPTDFDASFTSSTVPASDMGDSKLRSRSSKPRSKSVSRDFETGRTEKGSASDQRFDVVDDWFEQFPTWTVDLRILPVGAVDPSEVRSYCTSCGFRRRKDTWKFCPKCGSSL